MEMNTKNLMVFFLAILSVLVLTSTVSASTIELADIYSVEVNGLSTSSLDDSVAVTAGETATIEVKFYAEADASDVRMRVEIEGEKVDVDATTPRFDVKDGNRYVKTLSLKVPYELEDEVGGNVFLNIKIWNGDYETEEEIELQVQRPSYKVDFMSINVDQRVEAGETIPIDVVVKNIGYNTLDDLYVTLKIPALDIKKTSYFGDIVSTECYDESSSYCDEDDEDTARGRFYVKIPYDAKAGIYTIEVEASNSDLTSDVTKQFVVDNDVSSNIIVSSNRKTFAVGEEAVYDILVVNPTNKLKVYRIVTESSGSLTSTADSAMIAVPAGSSKNVRILVTADNQGDYSFNVNLFSGESLEGTVTLGANVEGTNLTSPIVVLTIVLAVIFIVLLIVLIVLLGRKPEKSEEFGESYY